MRARVLTLYSGDHCHLCDQAKALIDALLDAPEFCQAGWQLQIVSITGDPVLQEKYGTRIPVVTTPCGEEKGWPFTRGQLKKLMLAGE